MSEFTYDVLAFRQQEHSPIQVAFVAHAGEVLEWAGVPRKSDELLTGFQRFRDNKRINEQIVPFFQEPQNCSPTAIIVALLPSSGLGKCSLKKDGTPLNEKNVPTGQVIEAQLVVQVTTEEFKTDAVFEAAKTYVNNRLQNDETEQQISDMNEEDEEDGEMFEEELDNDSEDTEDSEEISHLGTSTLHRMKELLGDTENWKITKPLCTGRAEV